MSTPAFAWPEGRRVAVIVSVLLETWSEGKAPSYFPRTTPNKPGIPDIAGINWSTYGGKEGVWRLGRILDEVGLKATLFCNGRSAELYPERWRNIPAPATTSPGTATSRTRCSRS
jgi:allantoinase